MSLNLYALDNCLNEMCLSLDIDGVVPFLENVNSPVVIANVDDSDEPTFQNKYTKSFVIEKYERKIGVIGVILRTTNTIAQTGKLRFTNEATAVREEAGNELLNYFMKYFNL